MVIDPEQPVVVIGYGVVGQATAAALTVPHVPYDTGRGLTDATGPATTVVVATPCLDGQIDCYDSIGRFDPDVVIVRSTVHPQAMREAHERFPLAVVLHMPEWLSEATAETDALAPDKVVVGMASIDDRKLARHLIAQLFGPHYASPGLWVSYEASTLAKIAVNSMYALKVWLLSTVYTAAENTGVDVDEVYDDVCAAIAMDSRIQLSHAQPWHSGYRGFGGKCLPKDLAHLGQLAGGADRLAVEHLLAANDELVARTSRPDAHNPRWNQ